MLVTIGFVPRYRSLAVSIFCVGGIIQLDLLQFLFMLRLMPWYLSQPFNASFFWSFSFGVSTLATTGLHFDHGSELGLFHILAVSPFIFTNSIIALLLVRTFLLLVQGSCSFALNTLHC